MGLKVYGYHPGVDVNGLGGGNSDFGMPFKSSCDGVVIFEERTWFKNGGWGNLIMIEEMRLLLQHQFFLKYVTTSVQSTVHKVLWQFRPVGTTEKNAMMTIETGSREYPYLKMQT